MAHDSYLDREHDRQLEMLIADSIGTHPLLWGAMITIEAHGSIVALTGVVRSESNRLLADLLARTHGALSVDNQLRVDNNGAAQEAEPRLIVRSGHTSME